MNVRFSHANEFRFRPTNKEIDYINYYPRIDLMTQRVDYQPGIQANKYIYVDWVEGHEIFIQVQINPIYASTGTFRIYNVETGAYASATSIISINPPGWVGWNVIRLRFAPPITGDYYLSLNFIGAAENYISDVFTVKPAGTRKIVKIQYKNSYNKDGMVWQSAYYYAFFTGLVEDGEGESERSVSQEDDGVNLYNEISYSGLKLTLGQIHETQLKHIRKIFGCDDIIVDGIRVVSKNGIERTKDDKTDLYNVVINLTLRDIDDFANFD